MSEQPTASRTRHDKLIDAGLSLSSELSLETILQRIVELSVEITGARFGALGVLGSDGSISEFITEGVTPEQRAAIGHPPVGKGILGLLIDERRPMRIPVIGEDPRSYGFPPNHPPMKSFLGAPVTALGQVFGNIYLTENKVPTRSTTMTRQRSSCSRLKRAWRSRTPVSTRRVNTSSRNYDAWRSWRIANGSRRSCTTV
jgi:GAF domain-containing protein